MHASAHAQMARVIETYLPRNRHYTVVDFGSRTTGKQTATHRDLLRDHDCQIVGVDVVDGKNVDVVMKKPYRLPLRSNSVDVVVSGQVFEHVPFFWASLLEIARVLRQHGHFLMTAPSRGHVHSSVDCWRYYPDGLRAMAAYARLELLEAYTDFPPVRRGARHDYKAIETPQHYWGDTVGVFRKPARYPGRRMALVREPVVWWANRTRDIAAIGPSGPSGDQCGGSFDIT